MPDKRIVFQAVMTKRLMDQAKQVAEANGTDMSDWYRRKVRRAHKAMVAKNAARQDKAEGSYE